MTRIRRFLVAVALPMLFVAWPRPATAQQDGKVLDKTKAEWLAILDDASAKPRMRKAAVIALSIFGPGEADVLPALSKALSSDKDEAVRVQIASVLGSVKPGALRDSLPTLADVLKDDKSSAVRAATANLIGKLGELAKPALSVLVRALKDADASVRASAVEAIGQTGAEAKTAINDMLPLLKDADASVRYSTAFALGRFGPDAAAAIPELLQVLEKDSSAVARHEVARILGLIGGSSGKTVVPALVKALQNDKSDDVRRQLALTLAKMGDIKGEMKEILDVLKNDKDRTVRLYMIRSIPKCLGSAMKDYVKDYAEWLGKEPDADGRLAIIEELGALGPAAKEALDALTRAESDVVLQVREAARQAIIHINTTAKKGPMN
jgi:HEAT repeat protein